MSIAQAFGDLLNIDPGAVSKRVVFVKSSEFEHIWHIGDAALCVDPGSGDIHITVLHAELIPRSVVADSLNGLVLRELNTPGLCEQCVDEFRIAYNSIQANPQTRFENFYTLLEKSRKGN